jgi:hypothetical protein
MPASSKAQQRFFGLVKAVQNGEVPASKVTSNVRDAAADTSPEDAEEFASTNTKGLPDKVSMPSKKDEGVNFYEIVGRYNEYGKFLKRDQKLSELGQQLADIAEYAEYTLTNEMEDWFDKHTISRNIKEMRGYAKEFQKIAQEADSYDQRMTALYDDMGRVLERYFDIMDAHNGGEQPEAAPGQMGAISEQPPIQGTMPAQRTAPMPQVQAHLLQELTFFVQFYANTLKAQPAE